MKLGELGYSVERAGFTVADAVRLYAEYRERREGLEKVLQMSQARLASLEDAKAEANTAIGDAMENLEALNLELHDAELGATVDAEATDGASVGAAPPTSQRCEQEAGVAMEQEEEDLAAWRSARYSWSEASEDSYADNQFSEEDEEEDEGEEEGGGQRTSVREVL